MARKRLRERYLPDLMGELRSLPDRVMVLESLVDPVERLLAAIRDDHPNVKGIADVVGSALARCKEAIGTES